MFSQSDLITFEYIEDYIAKKSGIKYKLPIEVKNFLVSFKGTTVDLETLTNSVYRPIDLIELEEACKTKSYIFSFQDENFEDAPFILTNRAEQKILEEEDIDCNEQDMIDTKITNVYRFLPLYNGGPFYFIMIGLENGRLICYDQSIGTVLAPNFIEHIEDLITGIKSGYYQIDEEWKEIQFPFSNYLRKLTKEGKYSLQDVND